MTAGFLVGVTNLVGSPESVALAREWAKEKLGAHHPAIDDVMLLVSELVTNAVLHSNSRDGGDVTIAIADCHQFVHVDVVDEGGTTAPRVRDFELAETGRGLLMVEALSTRWAVYEDGHGRTVWFEVAYERDTGSSFPRQRSPADLPALRQRTGKHAAQTARAATRPAHRRAEAEVWY